MTRGNVSRLELLRRIHGSIERADRELEDRLPPALHSTLPARAELARQRGHVLQLVADDANVSALLHG